MKPAHGKESAVRTFPSHIAATLAWYSEATARRNVTHWSRSIHSTVKTSSITAWEADSPCTAASHTSDGNATMK